MNPLSCFDLFIAAVFRPHSTFALILVFVFVNLILTYAEQSWVRSGDVCHTLTTISLGVVAKA